MSDKTILANALIFDQAFMLLHSEMESGVKNSDMVKMSLFVPTAVNCAFSCELFLKSIIKEETKGHKLNVLFKKLDINTAAAIKKATVLAMQASKKNYTENDFDDDLCANASAFEQWRYFHESKTKCTFDMQFMIYFQKILKAIACRTLNGS